MSVGSESIQSVGGFEEVSGPKRQSVGSFFQELDYIPLSFHFGALFRSRPLKNIKLNSWCYCQGFTLPLNMEKPRAGPGYLLLMAEEDEEERRGRKGGLSCFGTSGDG